MCLALPQGFICGVFCVCHSALSIRRKQLCTPGQVCAVHGGLGGVESVNRFGWLLGNWKGGVGVGHSHVLCIGQEWAGVSWESVSSVTVDGLGISYRGASAFNLVMIQLFWLEWVLAWLMVRESISIACDVIGLSRSFANGSAAASNACSGWMLLESLAQSSSDVMEFSSFVASF